MSAIYHSFLYGRTKTEDYRWLVPPKINISSSFFGKVLENNVRKLRDGQILFYYQNLDTFAVFCVFFLSSEFVDERGRPIAFSAGLTCDRIYIRELNFRLSALIMEAQRFSELSMKPYLEAISLGILSVSEIPTSKSRIIDISSFFPNYSFEENNSDNTKEKTLSKNYSTLNSYLFKNDESLSLNLNYSKKEKYLCRCTNSDELKIFSKKLLNTANTPPILSNFESDGLGIKPAQSQQGNQGNTYKTQLAVSDTKETSTQAARMKELQSLSTQKENVYTSSTSSFRMKERESSSTQKEDVDIESFSKDSDNEETSTQKEDIFAARMKERESSSTQKEDVDIESFSKDSDTEETSTQKTWTDELMDFFKKPY